MTKDMDIDLEIEADEVAYIYLGTDKHNNLKNLDLPDSHPIRAITGLQEVVDKVGRTEDGAEVNEIVGVKVNGTPLDIAEDRTVDVPVPTSYGYYLDLDGENGIISLKDRDGVVLSTIDTNLERIVKSGRYDADTNELVLVLDDNTEIRIDASKLVDVYTADGETIVENGHVFSLSEGSKDALKDSADHIADRSNPHAVTKDQVGLSNVDNTSDAKKPISEATQSALNDCVKLSGSDSAQVIANGGLQLPNGDLSVGGGALIGKDTQPALLRVRGSIEATQNISGQLVQTEDVASNDSSTKVASTAWVASADSVVHTTGNESIGGIKTIKLSPIVEAWDGLHVRANAVEKGNSIVSQSGDMNIQFTDKNDNGNTNSRKIGGVRYTVSKNVGDNPARTFVELGNQYYRDMYLRLYDNGVEAYATTPSWSVGTADNSDKILTTKMANSLPSLVHTTGNETIAGTKLFTASISVETTWPLIVNRVTDYSLGVAPSAWRRLGGLHIQDKDKTIVGAFHVTTDTNNINTLQIVCNNKKSDGTTVSGTISVISRPDGVVYSTAPATADTHPNDAIVTKKYLLDKIAALEARISALEGA